MAFVAMFVIFCIMIVGALIALGAKTLWDEGKKVERERSSTRDSK